MEEYEDFDHDGYEIEASVQYPYLIGFGTEGIEWSLELIEYLEDNKERMISALKGEEHTCKLSTILHSMAMRDRFNSHRRIETYTVWMSEECYEIVVEALTDNQEGVKDLIRRKGELVKLK